MPAAVIGQPLPLQPLSLSPPHHCPKWNAKKFAFESLHFCCRNGEIEIASNQYPDELARLFTSRREDILHLRTYARLCNNMFSFSFLGGAFDAKTHKGIYVLNCRAKFIITYMICFPMMNNQNTFNYILWCSTWSSTSGILFPIVKTRYSKYTYGNNTEKSLRQIFPIFERNRDKWKYTDCY